MNQRERELTASGHDQAADDRRGHEAQSEQHRGARDVGDFLAAQQAFEVGAADERQRALDDVPLEDAEVQDRQHRPGDQGR